MSKGKVPTFAARLRELRTQAGLSITDLAAKAPIQRTYLHALEAGHKLPSLAIALRLAHALGVSLAEFDEVKCE